MNSELLGIHHVTAISGEAQTNLDYYSGLLGMRLVKISVNQDDVRTYHFFYGDETGSPGCDLTFFPHPGGYAGKAGAGQSTAVTLAVPAGSLDYWISRLAELAVPFDLAERFGERILLLRDPDGLQIELIESREVSDRLGWQSGPVPPEHTVRVISAVTLEQSDKERSARFLEDKMGFTRIGEDGERIRLRVGESLVDVVQGKERGRVAVGSIHHIAFRVSDADAQIEWLNKVEAMGLQSSGLVDRAYFKSLYFREPGGVLFEIATDGPGFAIDQSVEELGTRLALPPWLEPRRDDIERGLPPISLPGTWSR